MKVGDLVRFRHPDFDESYGTGVITGFSEDHFGVAAYFVGEIIYAEEDELEVISESR